MQDMDTCAHFPHVCLVLPLFFFPYSSYYSVFYEHLFQLTKTLQEIPNEAHKITVYGMQPTWFAIIPNPLQAVNRSYASFITYI